MVMERYNRKLPNPYAYQVTGMDNLAERITDPTTAKQKQRVERLQAGHEPTTLFTWATWQAFYKKYGWRANLQEALHKEAAEQAATDRPADRSQENSGGNR